jgi:hypothetical protein
MPTVLECFQDEWGVSFILKALLWIAVGLVISGVIAYLLRRFAFRFKHKESSVQGRGIVPFLFWLIVVGLFAAPFIYVWWQYSEFKHTHAIAFHSPSIAVPIQQIRDRFQGETKITVQVSDRAKGFGVQGGYEGACVRDLFEAICRQYSAELSCPYEARKMTIDLKR